MMYDNKAPPHTKLEIFPSPVSHLIFCDTKLFTNVNLQFYELQFVICFTFTRAMIIYAIKMMYTIMLKK